jgi:hypothetical protein
MKFFIASLLLFFTQPSKAHVIGQLFEESVYGKSSERMKVEGGDIPKNGFQDRRVYKVTSTTKFETVISLVIVSVKTGKIFAISEPAKDIYAAAEKASYYCEGTVKLPVEARWPNGLIFESEPGEKYRGMLFSIALQTARTEPWLEVECTHFLFN